MFDWVSKKIGFTVTEIKVLLFLAFALLLGVSYEYYKQSRLPEYKQFDYSEQDSLFKSLTGEIKEKLEEEIAKNNVDSKQEVLDFKPRDFKKEKKKSPPAEKSIDINKADINILKRLPGIGEKTAQKIIDLRKERSGFNNLNELMDVKGIGKSKFNKIKKFLYIGKSL
ncbi:helix-hairpin-helix motif protein [bacterium BMS3Abin03]|nr:helix-hairpin-helix motif protein [bacterium BMS3Abin03]